MILPDGLTPLAHLRQWVTYTIEPRANGKATKIPRHWQTGQKCSVTDPANRTTFEEANATGRLVGFVFTADDPYWFVDADNCFDEQTQSWTPVAIDLSRRFGKAFVEVSQSGHGLHFIGRGAPPFEGRHGNRCADYGLELYTWGRFVALTGRHARGDCDAEYTGELGRLASEYFPPSAVRAATAVEWTDGPCEEWDGPEDDDALIALALRASDRASNTTSILGTRGGVPAKAHASFRDLWEGDAKALSAHFPPDGAGTDAWDGSRADLALASHLAFWTGKDCERVERLMRASALVREKWDGHASYLREFTILKAVAGKTEVYRAPAKEEPSAPLGDPFTVEAPDGTLRSLQVTEDKTNLSNVEACLAAMGHSVLYDEFAGRILFDGTPLTDKDELLARADIGDRFCKFSGEVFGDGLRAAAYRNTCHPLREWLAKAETSWDGRTRLDSWLSVYLGAEDNEYIRTVGAIFLTAAVRRAREPGCKFDELLVLEGPQGIGKSTAVAALCPRPEWFSEDFNVAMESKQLLEITLGKWLVEAPELSKLGARDVEQVKHMLSRRTDSARLAYARNMTERPRQWVAFATVNADHYLSDPTGNRRFWPVKCGAINLTAIERDRAQLWAEAAQREAAGASIRLPEHLWAVAGEEQKARVEVDAIAERLEVMFGHFEHGKLWADDMWSVLQVPIERRDAVKRKAGAAMQRMGWKCRRVRREGSRAFAYFKGNEVSEIQLGPDGRNYQFKIPDLKAV